jgi:hypothetical protein
MVEVATDGLLVLHAIRVKGFVDEDGISSVTGLDRSDIKGSLRCHADAGWVAHRDGRFAGWSLTPAGRKTHRALLSADLELSGQRAIVFDAYERFLPVNGDFKRVCTDWQLRESPSGEPVPNDHRDDAYDGEVIGHLEDIHRRILDPLSELARIPRFSLYQSRLEVALAKVRAGDPDGFSRPLTNSYHDVWMELHEDLLVSLDLTRSGADSS